MVDLTFLPLEILNEINKLDLNKIFEIRLRKNRKVLIFYMDKYIYLNSTKNNQGLICTESFIKKIIENVTEHSLYAFIEQIKNGFLTTKNGIRIGICGDVIEDFGKIKTITNISSLNIRIPHFIDGCSKEIFDIICNGQDIKNTLIVSPPFMGKTTILKDLSIKINNVLSKQLLIIDERGEFENIEGDFIDKIRYSTKEYALTYSIRSISPEIIITDEIVEKDMRGLELAINSGIRIIASCHASNIDEIVNKNIKQGLFDYYIILLKSDIKGRIKNVYDRDFKLIK